MQINTALKDPTLLPESVVTRPPYASISVLLRLITEPSFVTTAHRLYAMYGFALLAFLAAEANTSEMTTERLEESFAARHLASYDTWTQAREAIIERFVSQSQLRGAMDEEFREFFDRDPRGFLESCFDVLSFVSTGVDIHVFTRPVDEPREM